MRAVLVYLRLYARCLADAAVGVWKNPWTLLLPVVLGLALQLLGPLLAPLGLVGGFLFGIVFDLLLSCYLYFLGGVVAKQKVSLAELKTSFGAYFWAIINVFFVLWVVNFALDLVLAANPKRGAIQTAFAVVSAVALNAVPEVLYLKGSHGGIETIQRSVRFLQDNWIEWFLPNGLLIAAAWAVLGPGATVAPMVDVRVWLVSSGVVIGLLGHVVMVFRGRLFQELDGSTHRQRMFKFRGTSAS